MDIRRVATLSFTDEHGEPDAINIVLPKFVPIGCTIELKEWANQEVIAIADDGFFALVPYRPEETTVVSPPRDPETLEPIPDAPNPEPEPVLLTSED